MKLGIVGFPKSGKTTLFHLLTGAGAPGARTGSRGEFHLGVARVPDPRVERLAEVFKPERVVHASLEVVDLAGFERGERAGLDVAEFRNADALLHVVRAFPSALVAAPPDPLRDARGLGEELVLADLEVVERRLGRLGPALKRKPTEAEERERHVLEAVRGPLEDGVPVRAQALGHDEARLLRGFQLLSQKPLLHCLNLGEGDIGQRDETLARLAEAVGGPGVRLGWVSAAIEAEVAALPAEEQRAFLEDLGLPEPALHRVLRDAYALLGLISFFTADGPEVRAWTVPGGATAVQAAGAVHSDMARGFIRAEVAAWDELLQAGSLAEARRRGRLRLEGKDYVVRDGELCHFRFNVGR